MGQSRVRLGMLIAVMMVLADGAHLEAQGRGQRGFRIPPGHMPPPGQCRVWYPGIPPGRQLPPVPCRVLRGHRFPGAVVLSGPVGRGFRDRGFVLRDDRFFRDDRRFRRGSGRSGLVYSSEGHGRRGDGRLAFRIGLRF